MPQATTRTTERHRGLGTERLPKLTHESRLPDACFPEDRDELGAAYLEHPVVPSPE